MKTSSAESVSLVRLIYDVRVRAILYQILAVVGVVAIGWYLFSNMSDKLARQSIATGFGFLSREAGFTISQAFIEYRPSDTYGRALLVGIVNTLWVSFFGCILATLIGTIVGILRLSSNPLLRLLMLAYVEALRNVPLLLYLFLWYAIIVAVLPGARDALNPLPGIYLSNGGLYVPNLAWSGAHAGVLVALALGIAAAMRIAGTMRRRRIETGRERAVWPFVLAAIALPTLLAFLVLRPDTTIDWPSVGRFRMAGGLHLTPEFTALLVGLSLSASAAVAEIVRSGIQSVAKGQWEAARAMGLHEGATMRLVVLPQALRVIVPPMTSTYLSLVKNSSLAIAIGYPDLVMVANTTMNQTGQAIEAIAIFMMVYLGLSLAISAFMNWYNARVAIKER
ncbi:amino acid ABC transporter permease [Salinarimonas sp.]|uniref:amino acid ABC transporter permease n=1 Tax=Salinarimonas sp. TaxID=2766526 RepID=UPI00391C4E38